MIKERVRATRHSLPFKMMPLLMLVKMVYNAVKWINAFPPKGGISEFLSPRTIMTGMQLNYAMDCCLAFGSYVQAHKEPNPTNGQAPRMVGAICIGPSGNIQGLYDFLNLCTTKKIVRQSWTPLPMPQEVIDRVNALGKKDGVPSQPTFFDREGRLIK